MIVYLRALRRGLGMSQDKAARALNVATITFSSWEQGLRSPDKWNLMQLSNLAQKSSLSAPPGTTKTFQQFFLSEIERREKGGQ